MAADEDRYQKVRVMMWRGETVPGLSSNAKLLWVYLLTSPDTTMIPGILSVGAGRIADDLGYDTDEVRAALAEITATGEVEFDPAGLVWFKKGLDHNSPDAPNNVKGWRRHWSEVKKCALKDVAWCEIRSWLGENKGQAFVEAFDLACPRPGNSKNPQNRTPSGTPSTTPSGTGLGTPSPTPSGTPLATQYQEQEQKQEQKQEEKNTAGEPAGACVHAYTHESPADDAPPETSRSGQVAQVMAQTALAAHVAPLATPDAPEVPPAGETARTAQPEAGAVGPGSLQLTLTPTDPPPAPPAAKGRSPLATCRPDSPEARVFAHWAQTLYPKAKPIFTRDRQLRIAARLAEGHSVETLCKAIDGVTFSDYHMGRDPAHADKDYRGLETVLRDAGQVDKFAAIAERKDPRHRPQVTRRVDARRAQLDAEVAARMATPMGDAEALAQIAYFNETGRVPNAAQMAALLAGRSVRDAIAMLTTTTAAEEVTV